MRRPDLPLIAIVLAVGIVLALTTDPRPAQQAGAGPAEAATPDAIDSMLADPDPSLFSCFQQVKPRDSASGASEDVEALVKLVEARVERLRELRYEHAVDAAFLSAPELEQRVEGLVQGELHPDDAQTEEEILELLGAVPPGTDLFSLTEQALGSQVIGLYDTKTRELLVQASGNPGTEEVITLAHELEHALVDQRLVLRERIGGKQAADQTLAYSTVVEGDATVTMELYALAYIGLDEQFDSIEGGLPGEREFARLPDYVQRNLVFPYLQGLQFICNRWAAGGWRAVDRLYYDPPASTAEVMFPERYGGPAPAHPPDLGEPRGSWQRKTGRELGAAELDWLFSAPDGDPTAGLPDPKRLVSGWAGGEVELWARGDERALGIALAELRGSNLLCGAFDAWYRQGWPDSAAQTGEGGFTTFSEDGRYAALGCSAREVRMGIAPDARTAVQIVAHGTRKTQVPSG